MASGPDDVLRRVREAELAASRTPEGIAKRISATEKQLADVRATYKKYVTDAAARTGGALPLWTTDKVMIRGVWVGTHWTADIKKKLEAESVRLQRKILDLRDELRIVKKEKNQANTPRGGGGGGGNTQPTYVKSLGGAKVTYNLPPVKSALFNPDAFKSIDGGAHFKSNSPSEVTDAANLWAKSIGSKGMIQTFVTPAGHYVPAPDGSAGRNRRPDPRIGFQFHYNPSSVIMGYDVIVEGFDPSLYVSGKVMPTNVPEPFGTINFSLALNRIGDMGLWLDSGSVKTPLDFGDNGAYPRRVAINEAKKIWEQGTMYDIRQLIKVANGGYEFNSIFRGKTPDYGVLLSLPVEVHLGKDLRYLGRISSLSIDHRIFDKRMVPIFSTVSLSIQRLPDISQKDFKLDASGQLVAKQALDSNTALGLRTSN